MEVIIKAILLILAEKYVFKENRKDIPVMHMPPDLVL